MWIILWDLIRLPCFYFHSTLTAFTTHPHSQCHRFIYTTTFTQMHIHHYFPEPELNTNGDYTIDTTPFPLYLPLYEYYTTHHCNFLVSLSISLIRQTAVLKYITNNTTLSPDGVYTTDHSPLLKRIGNLSVVSFVLLFTPITSGLPRLKHTTNNLSFTTTHFYDNDFLDCFISQSTVASTIHEQNLSPATTLFYQIFFTTVQF